MLRQTEGGDLKWAFLKLNDSNDSCPTIVPVSCHDDNFKLLFAIAYLLTKGFGYVRQETKHVRWIPTQSLQQSRACCHGCKTGYFFSSFLSFASGYVEYAELS